MNAEKTIPLVKPVNRLVIQAAIRDLTLHEIVQGKDRGFAIVFTHEFHRDAIHSLLTEHPEILFPAEKA